MRHGPGGPWHFDGGRYSARGCRLVAVPPAVYSPGAEHYGRAAAVKRAGASSHTTRKPTLKTF